MLNAFDTTAAVFDRDDLRVLAAAYRRALRKLGDGALCADDLAAVAKLVINTARDRMRSDISLRGDIVEVAIANQVVEFFLQLRSFTLCA